MKTYTEEEIKAFARKYQNMPEPTELTDEEWEEVQAVSAYVLNKYNKEKGNVN